ncbi:MAG: hypothetical protein OXC93_05750 [Rhodospirillaceae bacterium]|nr:hypothetical protein [Rhodospirillaceae bacterium]
MADNALREQVQMGRAGNTGALQIEEEGLFNWSNHKTSGSNGIFGGFHPTASQDMRRVPREVNCVPPKESYRQRISASVEQAGTLTNRALRSDQQYQVDLDNLTVSIGKNRRTSKIKRSGLVEGFFGAGERWHFSDEEMSKVLHLEDDIGMYRSIKRGVLRMIGGDLKDRMTLFISIGLSLVNLFNKNLSAETDWLNQPRDELTGVSPKEYLQLGPVENIKHVADLLRAERGLRV